jgi:hypothetical protein
MADKKVKREGVRERTPFTFLDAFMPLKTHQ